jgi:isopentenyl-diphosphate delta-isomerase
MTISEPLNQFEQRKSDHLRLALDPANQASGHSDFATLQLAHEAIPEINFDEVTLTCQRFQATERVPYFVSSMTAGHAGAIKINHVLARAAAQQGWAMGVGSQRRELFDETARQEWQLLREHIPNVVLYANLGLAQVIQTPLKAMQTLVDSISAQAIFIHCNPLQECIQPEGTPQFKGGYQALENVCQHLQIPVIIKETGCGFAPQTLKRLMSTGVQAVDVSGLGGTHWGRIEGQRAPVASQNERCAQAFKHWGVTTLDSLRYAMSLKPAYEIWASGGIRSGLDAAKCLALGATSIGIAQPLLQAAMIGVDAVVDTMQLFEYELKVALFCTGSRNLSELNESKILT